MRAIIKITIFKKKNLFNVKRLKRFFLLILLIKSNLLRLKGGLIGALFALLLISGILASTTIAVGSLIYAYRVKNNSTEDNSVQDLDTVNV